ncbi:hypothetical protein NHX12_003606 [Muraenolepis orangiensis]|uniref:Uncharacterized protein n=1 Tax=Muraenolepis orangiensis TaxID=630683 RepID=A0A9Q0IHH2_9TELE|nr:hypothetical protein NHX12_003606 [Muraenolepis orangiensis]
MEEAGFHVLDECQGTSPSASNTPGNISFGGPECMYLNGAVMCPEPISYRGRMSACGEESGEPSGSQELEAEAEPPKRKLGRLRKPQKEPTGEPVPKRLGADPGATKIRAPPRQLRRNPKCFCGLPQL